MIFKMDKKKHDALIMKYAPLVKTIVLRMAAKIPIDVADKEDLINVGIIGLMSALEKYDEKRNVQFETYAQFRIKGAVLDELRMRDWMPRSIRNKDLRVEKALRALQKRLGRAPSEQEVAKELDVTLDEYFTLLNELKGVSIVSTEDLPPDYLERFDTEEVASSLEQGNPWQYLAKKELQQGLKKAIDALPEKEKQVLSLYYYEELTMKEIGRVLDLTESRVCQIHAQAALRLRASVKDYR